VLTGDAIPPFHSVVIDHWSRYVLFFISPVPYLYLVFLWFQSQTPSTDRVDRNCGCWRYWWRKLVDEADRKEAGHEDQMLVIGKPKLPSSPNNLSTLCHSQ